MFFKKEITDINQLESKIIECSQLLSNEANHKIVLLNSCKAQLEVIHVAKNPTLAKSAFDIMLQFLSDATEDVHDNIELRNIQRRSALMTSNMIFFFDAYLYYKNGKLSYEGEEILKKACDTLADTVNGIFGEIKNNPTVLLKKVNLPIVIGKHLFLNISKNKALVKSIVSVISESIRTQKWKISYYDFLISVIEKLKRYKSLFGKSIILAELIHNKKDDIANYIFSEPFDRITQGKSSLFKGILYPAAPSINTFGKIFSWCRSDTKYAINSAINSKEELRAELSALADSFYS